MSNRALALFAVCTLLLLFLNSCEEQEQVIAVESVSISPSSAEVLIGDTLPLKVKISPENATDKEGSWKSSAAHVASVSQDGIVKGVAEGTATITVVVGGKSSTSSVTVRKPFVEVSSIELDKHELAMVEGDAVTLLATVKPDDATDKSVEWSSSNPLIATVDADGKVAAIKAGQAEITAKAGNRTDKCKVTVTAKKIDVESISLNMSSIDLIVGEEFVLTATITPQNASVQTVEWSTTDANIASVEEGKVKAIKEGEAKIVALADGKEAECVVNVNYIEVQSVILDITTLHLEKGEC